MIEQKYNKFKNDLSNYVYQKEIISRVIFITFLINWSILIEDLPWTWKTTLSKAIAKLFGFDFSRIHATSDLMPQDIIWWEYFNINTKNIEIKKWPIFTEVFLVDEINRMNPKTQSAFLQAMEEKKVSILWQDFELSEFFSVIATQNPIEYSWTFSLPEAQKDRFFSKISLWSPSKELQENLIVNNWFDKITQNIDLLEPIITKDELKIFQNDIKNIAISKDLAQRLVSFFELINTSDKIIYPISQRWISIFIKALKANAYINNRNFVVPQDWVEIMDYFLVHRLDIEKSNNMILKSLYAQSFKHF